MEINDCVSDLYRGVVCRGLSWSYNVSKSDYLKVGFYFLVGGE